MATISLHADRTCAWLLLHRDRLRRVGLMAAMALFAGGFYLSLNATPDLWSRLTPLPFLLLLLVVHPVITLLNAVDFQVLAKVAGTHSAYWSAFRVNIYASAANMLPIPGSLAARATALKVGGVTLRRSGGLVLLFTAIWGGLGFCYSAAWLSVHPQVWIGAGFAAIGVAILALCAEVVRRHGLPWPLVGAAASLRLGFVVLQAVALMLAMRAIGVPAGIHQTSILVVASFIAALFPAGIGIRESAVALLSPIVGIDPAFGFLASAVSRAAEMAWLIVAAGLAQILLHRESA